MVEASRSQFVLTESDLLVPKNNLVVPDRRKIASGELPGIFGVDVRLLTQEELIRLGILPKGSELIFLNDPIVHTYKDIDDNGNIIETKSDGQYFLETVIGEDGVLASYLPPYSMTSEHEHEAIKEKYKQIAGQSFVNVGNEKVNLNSDMGYIEVPLNTEHQVLTEEKPSFILIVMSKAGLVPRDQWHKPTRKYSNRNDYN